MCGDKGMMRRRRVRRKMKRDAEAERGRAKVGLLRKKSHIEI